MSGTMSGVRAAGVVLPWATGRWAPSSSHGPRHEESPRSPEPIRPPGAPTGTPAVAIPAGDRLPARAPDVLSAAVIVDVLTTATSRLQAEPTVLAGLAGVALELLRIGAGGEDETRARDLFELAASPAGTRRAAVAGALAGALAGGRPDAVAALPCSPSTVAEALRRIEATSRIMVREAVALLEARELTAYHQA